MKRWIAAALGLGMAVCAFTGCTKHCFVSEQCYRDAHAHLLPAGVESGDASACVQATIPASATPPSVDQPDRPPRYLTLQEAIAIALENGTPSGRTGIGTGVVDDNLVTGAGVLTNQADRVRVLALNPAIAGATIEANLARFDALWVTSMNWSKTDNLQQGLSSFNNGDRANFVSGLVKQMASGGTASLAFETDYALLNNPPIGSFGVINPNYTSKVSFGFEQPLLRNFGTEINQLLQRAAPISGLTMPRELSSGLNTQQGQLSSVASQPIEGILIARLRFDQQRAEFERQMQILLLNVEVAYWKLYQAYGRLYSFEEVMRIAHKSWMMNDAKFRAGTVKPGEFYPIRGQYEEFRGERMAALGDVLEKERNLRGILGLPVEDGSRLVPLTPPALAPYRPDWEVSLGDALSQRPELVLARENLRAQQLALIREKNLLKPDLRFIAQYSPLGYGTELVGDKTFVDGAGTTRTSGALGSLGRADFNDWVMGLTLNVPLGYRLEHAAVRSARLQLAQSYYVLKDQEEKATRVLAQQYQKISEWYRLIESRRAERKAYADAVDARFREMAAGKPVIEFLLESQRRLAAAQVKEYEAIAEYNNSLARFEWAKGSALQHNSVVIAEGILPQCCQVRAVEHERQRAKALVLKQRPEPMTCPGQLAGDANLPQQLDAPADGQAAAVNKAAASKAAAPAPKNLPISVKSGGALKGAAAQPASKPEPKAAAKTTVKEKDTRFTLPRVADQGTTPPTVDAPLPPATKGAASEQLPMPAPASNPGVVADTPPLPSLDMLHPTDVPEFKASPRNTSPGSEPRSPVSESAPRSEPGMAPTAPTTPPELPALPQLPAIPSVPGAGALPDLPVIPPSENPPPLPVIPENSVPLPIP